MLLKFELYKKQRGRCVYTDAALPLSELENLEVEHIFPRSRGGADAMYNYVLTDEKTNKEKGDRTPFEWLSSDKTEWESYCDRVRKLTQSLGAKRCKLLVSPNAEELAEKYTALAETAWISKLAQKICCVHFGFQFGGLKGEKKVWTVSDNTTAMIRGCYGLNRLLHDEEEAKDSPLLDRIVKEKEFEEKNRKNKKHHALDAMCICFVPTSNTKKALSRKNILPEEIARNPESDEARNFFAKYLADVVPNKVAIKKPALEQTIYSKRAHLDPERLGDSPTTDLGAPIVDSRNMVVSGNGIILAIRQAYDTGNADAYRKYVQQRARSMGLEIPANVKNPVLVRRVDDLGGMSMEEFAAKSNKSDLAGMSNAENAIADARRILDAHLLDRFFPSDNGDVLAASNNDFITEFLDIVGGREEYIDKNGARKPNLAPRIKAAVLAAMLNPEKRDIIENLLDNPQGWSGLINGLFGSVANLAKLDGNADYNLADELSKAVEIFVGLQRAGESVATFNAQGDMFNEPISDETGFLIELFEKNTRTPTGISGVLNTYYNLVKNIDTTTQDMFGEENPSKIDELRAAYQKYSTSLTEEPNVSWRDTGDSDAEKIDRQHREFYERYKNGEVSAEELQREIDDFMGDFHSERTPERKIIERATPKEKIYNIDEAVDFVRKNLLNKPIHNYVEQEGKIVSATISRNCLDKINSGKSRGKTNNNRLYALAVANIDRLFTLSRRLESEPPKNGSPELKAVHRHYAPLLMDGKIYAVKLTVKEFDEKTGNRIYSIEGIDVNGESDLSGLSKKEENPNSSAAIQRSDSVKEFIDEIRNVNKKFHDLARKKISDKTYEEAAKLVADYAESKGYPTDVYHGTGADGFNVAKADASEARNGEGAQAHGMGLYLATNKRTSERYQINAPKDRTVKIGNVKLTGREAEVGLDKKTFDFAVDELLKDKEKAVQYFEGYAANFRHHVETITARKPEFAKKLKFARSDKMREHWQKVLASADESIEKAARLAEQFDEKKRNIQKVAQWIKEQGLSVNDIRVSHGKVFDWRTNLAKENTLDEQLPFSRQSKEVQEKIQAAIETLPTNRYRPNPSETFKDLVENDWDGKTIYDEIVEYTKSKRRATEHLLDHGIKGITYDGRQDGRCYVSFEGGAAVKLQDPFTFDDNGKLIPLSERFDTGNPDMRWKDDTKAEADTWAKNIENVRKAAELYLSKQKGQIVVDPDEIRKLVPNYEISNNSSFVSAGDEILEVVWAKALKEVPKNKPVVLLTGNPAAGKGTARSRGLLDCVDTAGIVFDAPQNSFESVEKRVREAIDSGHNIRLVQIYNDPITSWENSLKRGILKGRFLPLKYFVERAYERAQGKVKKIENNLKSFYDEKLETIYIDSSGNNPRIVSPEEAKAWDYSIDQKQLKKIEEITYENIGRIKESARLRGDKKNPLASIASELPQTLEYRNVSFGRVFPEGISGRDESGNGRNKFGVERGRIAEENGESYLKYLLRQERTENPVIWASIVLAREILNGRGITRAKVEKLLPTGQFDGSKQNYAVERAQRIAEKTKATQKEFAKDLDVAIRKAESNLYWQDEFVENAYRAFSKGGEEYGFAKQRLMQYLKDLKNKELNKVKGYETEDFDVDLVEAILKAQEAEPERVSADESKTAGEETEEELEESGGAFEGDEEFSGKKTPLAPSKIRDVIGAIRREVVRRVRDSDGDQKTLDEKYRKTLVNVLTDAMKELVYGKEREDIGRKIEELKNVKHAVITVKDGERVGQKIDNFTLRAENIALRIFKRGVRDSKKLMTEKLDAILKRRGKKPSRMQRDDKRSMTGLVQQRIHNISKYVEMDAEALEDVRREAVAKLEDVDGNFVQDAEKGKIREDVEDVRAAAANVLHDIEMFGVWADKSRAEMAQALEFLEKTIDTETAAQKERVEKRKERNAKIRKIISDALKMSEHNAARDGGMRVAIRKVLNGSLPFDSFLGLLGESATGETRKLFEEWRKDFVARVDRAANAKANEYDQRQFQLYIKVLGSLIMMNGNLLRYFSHM